MLTAQHGNVSFKDDCLYNLQIVILKTELIHATTEIQTFIISYTDIIVRSTCRGHFLRFEVQLARWKMNILPSAATLGLSADEFLPHNPCLSLWSSEGIVFVYSQAFFHQEHSRQCGEKEKEEETGRERWKNQELFEEWSKNEKLLCKCFNPARPVGVCVCVCGSSVIDVKCEPNHYFPRSESTCC